jgi:hypothetical protein
MKFTLPGRNLPDESEKLQSARADGRGRVGVRFVEMAKLRNSGETTVGELARCATGNSLELPGSIARYPA